MTTRRDETGDWIIPEGAVPTIGELEDRIEVAISIARSSEAAAMTVADAAIESAEQARRAAELAERAAAMVASGIDVPVAGLGAPSPAVRTAGRPAPSRANGAAPASGEWLLDFSQRADRLVARLSELARG